ncbi:MAG: hypothetical protein KatS3mg087_1166 [Patescibacteria group bacterium]|nr:MAG: hypothetical protein KatS3mg087_1166 [Patescibacteria group bacterium]
MQTRFKLFYKEAAQIELEQQLPKIIEILKAVYQNQNFNLGLSILINGKKYIVLPANIGNDSNNDCAFDTLSNSKESPQC